MSLLSNFIAENLFATLMDDIQGVESRDFFAFEKLILRFQRQQEKATEFAEGHRKRDKIIDEDTSEPSLLSTLQAAGLFF